MISKLSILAILVLTGVEISFDVLSIVLFCGTALFFIYRKLLQPSYVVITQVISSVPKINMMYEQLNTNGGMSLRDAVNRIENTLATVQEKQNVYLMDSEKGVFETDDQGLCTFVNRTYCRMLRITEKEAHGNGWINYIADDWREGVQHHFASAVKNQIEFKMNLHMRTSDGVEFPVIAIASPIRVQKKVIGYIGFVELAYMSPSMDKKEIENQ